MNCPSCNTPNAYVGLTEVECVNSECKFFNSKLLLGKNPCSEIIIDYKPMPLPSDEIFKLEFKIRKLKAKWTVEEAKDFYFTYYKILYAIRNNGEQNEIYPNRR